MLGQCAMITATSLTKHKVLSVSKEKYSLLPRRCRGSCICTDRGQWQSRSVSINFYDRDAWNSIYPGTSYSTVSCCCGWSRYVHTPRIRTWCHLPLPHFNFTLPSRCYFPAICTGVRAYHRTHILCSQVTSTVENLMQLRKHYSTFSNLCCVSNNS